MCWKLYGELADWWPLVSAPAEYAEEAGFYRDLLNEACRPESVLELGSGGGNNAYHLQRDFRLTLVDLSPEMQRVSRALNPECEHLTGDMRSIRLGREFDAVFIHDAVMYLVTEDDLSRALKTAALHCRPGGAVLVVPDWFAETYEPGISTGGHDGDGRALRYMQWNHEPRPGARRVLVDYAFLLHHESGAVDLIHDRHEVSLLPRERWLELCRDAGLEPRIRTVMHSDLAPQESEVLLCRKPAGGSD